MKKHNVEIKTDKITHHLTLMTSLNINEKTLKIYNVQHTTITGACILTYQLAC